MHPALLSYVFVLSLRRFADVIRGSRSPRQWEEVIEVFVRLQMNMTVVYVHISPVYLHINRFF